MDYKEINELNNLEIENSNNGFDNLSKLKQKKLTYLRNKHNKYKIEQNKNISLNYDLSKIKHLIPSQSDNTIELDDSDFDDIVREVYGVDDYYVEADMELTDNSFVDADISPNESLSEYEVLYINDFVKNKKYNFIFQTIVKDLGIRNILPFGQYRIIRY